MPTLQKFIQLVLVLIVVGLVFWLLWWLVGYVGLPEPFAKIANVVLACAAVFTLIAVLMDMAGYPIVRMPPPKT